jgi:hypothetical protein
MGWVWNYEQGVCTPPPNCPIVLATGRASNYKLTSAEDGVLFDIDGDGVVERVGWTEIGSDVAFLAIDRDGDGRISSGRELFGNHTLEGARNGFIALERMAMAANDGRVGGSVNASDPIFQRLLLWTDRDHDGISAPSELRPLTEVFAEVGLGYQDHHRKDGRGNHYAYRGWALFRTQQGRNKAQSPEENEQRRRAIYDVVLATMR